MKLRYLLEASLISAVINIALTPIFSAAAACFGYLMIICFWMYAIALLLKKRLIKSSILFLLAIVVLSIVFSLSQFSSEGLRKKIISSFSFFVFYLSLSFPADADTNHNVSFKGIYYSGIALTFIFLIYTFVLTPFAYTPFGKYGSMVFTMGMGNPNGTAVYVLFASMMLSFGLLSEESKLRKTILLCLIGALAYIMYLLSSRTVVICFLLEMGIVMFLPKLKRGHIFRWAVLLAPLLIIFLQFRFSEEFGDFRVLGKKINTGRLVLYRDLLQHVLKNPLMYIFGNLCGNNFRNFHNGILTVFASLGITGVIWTLNAWATKLKAIERNVKSRQQLLAYYFVLLLLLDSVFESMTIVGTLPHGLLVYLMVKIAQGDILPENVTIQAANREDEKLETKAERL